MAQDERTREGRVAESPAASPPGYGGISEGTVGDPGGAGQGGAPAAPQGSAPAAAPQGSAGNPGAREKAARGEDLDEGDADDAVDTPRGGGSSNEVIPGVLDQSKPLTPESSAEHKSSWPDEGATGEAGAG
ncbi:hypothetical protein WME89_10110 [Sorangium sp. So ce321]|uniref:hypothetical protein n=1 Tax=Sorangium sp. So ce321 TaxID=3133300 RepID=UPI003F600133